MEEKEKEIMFHAKVIWKIQESRNIHALQTYVLWNTGDSEESKIIKWDKFKKWILPAVKVSELCLSVISSVCVCVCVCLPACQPVCPSVHFNGCLPVSVSTYLSTCLPPRPSVHPSISLPACISVSVCLPAVCPPACSSICPFVYFHGCLPVSVYVCLCIRICLSKSDNGSIFLGVLQVSVIYKVAFAWAQYAFSACLLFFVVDETTTRFQMTLNDLISKRRCLWWFALYRIYVAFTCTYTDARAHTHTIITKVTPEQNTSDFTY